MIPGLPLFMMVPLGLHGVPYILKHHDFKNRTLQERQNPPHPGAVSTQKPNAHHVATMEKRHRNPRKRQKKWKTVPHGSPREIPAPISP